MLLTSGILLALMETKPTAFFADYCVQDDPAIGKDRHVVGNK